MYIIAFTEEEEDNSYLVDFQQKYIDKALRHHEANAATNAATNADDGEGQERNNVKDDDDWYVHPYVSCDMFVQNVINHACVVYQSSSTGHE